MTDQPDSPKPPADAGPGDRTPTNGASSNGFSREGAASVRSGLARRRNPAIVFLGDFAGGARRLLFRDALALFLLLASIGLAIAFAELLGDIKPSSSGLQVPISTVQTLAGHKQIASAVLLDHDNRVE
ncbi:MAG TPA: cell division protein FtsH, partial [Solirubrobacteraceae bacterium]|nr:cell division protein FtsH [Solirubrobacteraceae bacterium]